MPWSWGALPPFEGQLLWIAVIVYNTTETQDYIFQEWEITILWNTFLHVSAVTNYPLRPGAVGYFNYWKIADIQARVPRCELVDLLFLKNRKCKSLNISNPSKVFWKTYVSMSVVLKPFHVKDPQNYMYLATDPLLNIFCSRDPPQMQAFTKICSKFKVLHMFPRFFKNSRSTSSQHSTE